MRVSIVKLLEKSTAQFWSGLDKPSSKKLPGIAHELAKDRNHCSCNVLCSRSDESKAWMQPDGAACPKAGEQAH